MSKSSSQGGGTQKSPLLAPTNAVPFATRFTLRTRFAGRPRFTRRSTKDFAFVRDLVESLQKNKVGNAEEIAAAENELARVRNMYNNTIPELETKVNQLMLLLDGG